MTSSSKPTSELGKFQVEFAACWREMPSKGLFLALLVVWCLFFHLWGNSTLGYVDTPSLFGWMHYAFNNLEDDRHCKFIPFVVLALFWWKRAELLAVPKSHAWSALGLVVCGLALHFLGYVVQQTRISMVGFFVGLYGLIGLTWGRAFMTASFFPYTLFVFCLPLGTLADSLTFPLRALVTHISVGLSHTVLGIDVFRDGTRILSRQGFNYDVAAACSGIRSLTVLLALTTIYGFTTFRATWKRLMMVALAVPLAVVGNVIRIMGVIITADAFGEAAGLKFHDAAGFVTFGLALVCVMALGYWLREEPTPAAAERSRGVEFGAGLGLRGAEVRVLVAALVVVGASAGFLVRQQKMQRLGEPGLRVVAEPIHDEKGVVRGTNSVFLPAAVLDYQSEPLPVSDIELGWLPPDTTFGRRLYKASDGFQAAISVVLMGTDRTSIHKPQYCLYGQGWQIDQTEHTTIRVEKPRPYELPIVKLTTSRSAAGQAQAPTQWKGIYVYWFVADGQLTSDHGERMWWMARDLLRDGVLQRWAYVTCFAVCPPGQEQAAFDRVKQFLSEAVPQFQLTAGVARPAPTAAASLSSATVAR